MKEINEFLKQKGITPTPVRVLVWRCLRDAGFPLSMSDIEARLGSVDKSSISRTLSLFRNNNLLHSLSDGSGSVKYEISQSAGSAKEKEHIHFRCEKCGVTLCLTSIKTPVITLPPGFISHESNFIISGICSNCSNNN